MGGLAEYVYYDEERLRLIAATHAKLYRIRQTLDLDGRQHPLVEDSYAQVGKELNRYEAKLAEKKAFLAAAYLVLLPLPATPSTPFSSFRGELYKHVPSGETVLVFRGTASAHDWLTNLWLGVDLFKIEAPNYAAARKLTEAVVKSGLKPIVVGHSLGAGMAQYVGVLHGLKVVGFNSSPLPESYLSSRPVDPRQVRLFSAIEVPARPAEGGGNAEDRLRPDPVSIRAPQLGEWVNSNNLSDGELIKAHQHLVKPLCVLSRPEPFTTPQEDEQAQAIRSSFIAKGIFTGVLKPGILNLHKTAPAEQGTHLAIKAAARKGMNHPVWRPDSSSSFDKAVAAEVVDRVEVAAVKAYQQTFTMAGAVRTGGEFAFGSLFKGLLDVGATLTKDYVAQKLVTHGLMPHGMDRFNRGMQAARNSDVFDADVVKARCLEPASIY